MIFRFPMSMSETPPLERRLGGRLSGGALDEVDARTGAVAVRLRESRRPAAGAGPWSATAGPCGVARSTSGNIDVAGARMQGHVVAAELDVTNCCNSMSR